jgi:hypothetical protein
VPQEALITAIVVLSSTGSFGLGLLAAQDLGFGEGDQIWIEDVSAPGTLPAAAAKAPDSMPEQVEAAAGDIPAGGQYVASRSGARYYFPWCSGAKQIKEENKVWFATKEAAEAKGYTPAKNCKGL